MFPESHSHAFGVTAYQAAWLKRYHPLEFFVTLINNQPMGFYPMETLKQDACRFGVPFLNPCVNRSDVSCIPHNGAVLLGLRLVKDVGEEWAKLLVEERKRHGLYTTAGDLVRTDGTEIPGCVVPRHGRGFRRHHLQPTGGALGSGALPPALAQRPVHVARFHGGQRASAWPTSPPTRRW